MAGARLRSGPDLVARTARDRREGARLGEPIRPLRAACSRRASRYEHAERELLRPHDPAAGVAAHPLSGYEDSFFGHKFSTAISTCGRPSADNRWSGRHGLTWLTNRDKINYNFSKRIAIDQGFAQLDLGLRGDQVDPAYPWQWDHRITNAPTIFEDNVQSSLQWRRTLSTAGYRVPVSRLSSQQNRRARQELDGVRGAGRSPFLKRDPRRDDFFQDLGRDGDTWQDRCSTSWRSLNPRSVARRHEIEGRSIEHQFQSVVASRSSARGVDQTASASARTIPGASVGRRRVPARQARVRRFHGQRRRPRRLPVRGPRSEIALGDRAANIAGVHAFYRGTRACLPAATRCTHRRKRPVAHPITELP